MGILIAPAVAILCYELPGLLRGRLGHPSGYRHGDKRSDSVPGAR